MNEGTIGGNESVATEIENMETITAEGAPIHVRRATESDISSVLRIMTHYRKDAAERVQGTKVLQEYVRKWGELPGRHSHLGVSQV